MMPQLLITLFLVVGFTVSVTGQSLVHPSDDCIDGSINTTTHHRIPGYKIFCMGSKDNEISYQLKTGCFIDASCDYFMSAKIVTNPKSPYKKPHMLWNIYAKNPFNGYFIFFLNWTVTVIPRDLDLRNVNYVNTRNHNYQHRFTTWQYSEDWPDPKLAGYSKGTWKETEYKDRFYRDYGGDPPFHANAILVVGPEKRRVSYQRVAVTTWNERPEDPKDMSFVPNARMYPLVPYLIGVKDNAVTVVSPMKLIRLFSDDVTKMTLNTVAEHYWLDGYDITTTIPPPPSPMTTTTTTVTPPTAPPITQFISFWFIIGAFVILAVVMIGIIYVIFMRFRGKGKEKDDDVRSGFDSFFRKRKYSKVAREAFNEQNK